MKEMIGKTIKIPEDVHNAVNTIQKERDKIYDMAKQLLQESHELKKDLFNILNENIPDIEKYRYMLNTEEMTVTILHEKK